MVVSARLAPPELVEVAGQAAGGVDHGAVLVDVLVEDADHLGLVEETSVTPGMEDLAVDPVPLLPGGADLALVGVGDAVAGERLAQVFENGPGIADERQRAVLVRVVGAHVHRHETHGGILELRLGGGREVGKPAAEHEHQVRALRDAVGGQGPRRAQAPETIRIGVGQHPFPGLGHAHRDVGLLDEGAQRGLRLRVVDAPARDDERAARPADHLRGRGQAVAVGPQAGDPVDALLEEMPRVVEGLGLDVLGQGEGHRARGGRIGHHAHGLGERGEELLGPVDAVPVPRHGTEAVVDTDVHARRKLELLEHRCRLPVGEDVAGQEQHGKPVDGGGGRARDHVRGPRADRAGAGEGPEPAARLGEGHGGVHHRLLVLGLVVGQLLAAVVVEGLAESRHVAVAEDAEDAVDEPVTRPVALDVLPLEELDDGPGRGESPCARAHGFPSGFPPDPPERPDVTACEWRASSFARGPGRGDSIHSIAR